MTDKKTNWDDIERLSKGSRKEPNPIETQLSQPSPNPNANEIARKSSETEGVIANFKQKKIERRAQLEAVRLRCDGELEALQHKIVKAIVVEKAKADVMAEEFLKELDAQHLKVLSDLGLRNKETREKALIELTESTVQRIREVKDKDWPQFLVEETVNEILALRKRALNEIMDELGQE